MANLFVPCIYSLEESEMSLKLMCEERERDRQEQGRRHFKVAFQGRKTSSFHLFIYLFIYLSICVSDSLFSYVLLTFIVISYLDCYNDIFIITVTVE